MMKVVIIEDEAPAARRLQDLLEKQEKSFEVLAVLDSIYDSVQWLLGHESPDLIFMDIMLADGQSFEIFEKVEVKAPVIFTTAYDEYALKAFTVNSIDYLLKPIDPPLLSKAISKLQSLRSGNPDIGKLIASFINDKMPGHILAEQYKERFLVKTGEKMIPIAISEIAYFYTEDRVAFLMTFLEKRFMIDFTLDELEKMLNPRQFFRFNRQFIGAFGAVKHIHPFFNGKLKIYLKPEFAGGTIISKDKAPVFKQWLNQ